MAQDRSAINIVRESKLLAYTLGAITVAAGIVLLAWPDRSFTFIARVAGVLLVVVGAGDLIEAVRYHRGHRYWGLVVLRGAVNLGFGLVLVLWPDISVNALVWLLGLDLVLAGILGLIVRGQQAPEYRKGTFMRSIVTILFGVVIMVWPSDARSVIAVVVGSILVLFGLIFLWSGYMLSKAKVDVIDI